MFVGVKRFLRYVCRGQTLSSLCLQGSTVSLFMFVGAKCFRHQVEWGQIKLYLFLSNFTFLCLLVSNVFAIELKFGPMVSSLFLIHSNVFAYMFDAVKRFRRFVCQDQTSSPLCLLASNVLTVYFDAKQNFTSVILVLGKQLFRRNVGRGQTVFPLYLYRAQTFSIIIRRCVGRGQTVYPLCLYRAQTFSFSRLFMSNVVV